MRAATLILAIPLLCSGAFTATTYVPDHYPTIQDAIVASSSGDTIVVRPGTYFENIDFNGKAIMLKSDGGPEVTVIDGGRPQNPNVGSVVTFISGEGSGSVVDGFTITNGTGTILGSHRWGGGIYCDNASSPTIQGNRIVENLSGGGGGVYCIGGSSPAIVDNLISKNFSLSYDGGGLYVSHGLTSVISGNRITDNHALSRNGGGAVIWDTMDAFIGNEIAWNTSASYGGGLIVYEDRMVAEITGNSVHHNQAWHGGGIYCFTDAVIEGNRIYANSATEGGGLFAGGLVDIRNNLIRDNEATQTGGGAYLLGRDMVLTGNTIYGNRAGITGGGISGYFSFADITSSILWNNEAPIGKEIDVGCYSGCSGMLSMRYSTVEGGLASIVVGKGSKFIPGPGMIEDDPLFVDATNEDFRLRQSPPQTGVMSPCVDAGDPLIPVIAGSTRSDRIADSGLIDIGYHYPLGRTVLVPVDYPAIQDAIEAAADGDVVLVAPGTYLENIDFLGKSILLRSESGPAMTVIDGGQTGSGVSFRSSEGKDSVLDGFTLTNGNGGSVEFGGGIYCESANPKIMNNIVRDNTAFRGGGVYCFDSSPELRGNTISGNVVGWSGTGGGIHCQQSSPLITDNEILSNSSDIGGGGICVISGSPAISGNTIEGNYDRIGGGGIYLGAGAALVRSNRIIGNESGCNGGGIGTLFAFTGSIESNVICGNRATAKPGTGGGIACNDSTPHISSNMVYDNSATHYGGGIYLNKCMATIANNTIYGNQAPEGGGFCFRNSCTKVVNCILWANRASVRGHQYCLLRQFNIPSILTVGFSNVETAVPAGYADGGSVLNVDQGMMSVSPGFKDEPAQDFRLEAGSPCREAGWSLKAGLPDRDFEGDPRISGPAPDVGADEFHPHLSSSGSVPPGGSVTVCVAGDPGGTVVIGASEWLAGVPKETPYGFLFLKPPVILSRFGVVGQDGYLTRTFTIPASWTSGETRFLQARAGKRLTNPHTLLVE